ncbi:MAG: DNA/RNA nuclease SfsA [Defluviitaleaceae bacterium]|nr:DNA/RNA nuclease SfsA [Defluviitaleaceae bacterium]
MRYTDIFKATFINRPNRFIAQVEIGGKVETCHVKNTGRCRELLTPGATVYVNHVNNPARVTQYDLVAVEKGGTLINMDSYAPNLVFGEYLRQGKFTELGEISLVKPEAKYGQSRFDFYVEASGGKAFIEVKGVTLEHGGVAMFPDAPTERGIKHLNHLAACIANGYEAYVVFVIQMKGMKYFTPAKEIHSAFGETLARVSGMGGRVRAFDCVVKPGEMVIDAPLPVEF